MYQQMKAMLFINDQIEEMIQETTQQTELILGKLDNKDIDQNSKSLYVGMCVAYYITCLRYAMDNLRTVAVIMGSSGTIREVDVLGNEVQGNAPIRKGDGIVITNSEDLLSKTKEHFEQSVKRIREETPKLMGITKEQLEEILAGLTNTFLGTKGEA